MRLMLAIRSSNVFILACLLSAFPFLTSGCSGTKTVSENVESAIQHLKLKSGDTVKVITINRERYFLEITSIGQKELLGTTLNWDGASAEPGTSIAIDYSDLALIQQEYLSTGETTGFVASITVIGAMVAAVAIGAPPVMVPP